MFFIFSSTVDEDYMSQYNRDELDEVFGEYDANQLVHGISVVANGGVHINAAHAALREATDIWAEQTIE